RGDQRQKGVRLPPRPVRQTPPQNPLEGLQTAGGRLSRDFRGGHRGGSAAAGYPPGGAGGGGRAAAAASPLYGFYHVRNQPRVWLYPGALLQLRPEPSDLFLL